jgi:ABC-type phosphate/phosphonate transport system permease subunit
MSFLEALIIAKAMICLVLIIYLRKEFDRHGFRIWIFTVSPMFVFTIIAFVLWQESPSDFSENLFFSIAALAMAIAFIGTFIAVSKGRR